MPPIGRLHLITDTRPGRDALAVVAAGLAAGADTIQVRVPDDATDRDAYDLATRVLALCRPAGVTCLVNDRLHVALAVGADGGHVGADDLPVAAARRILGPYAVLGATARDPETARRAVADGASYLGVGPAYATSTKSGLPTPIGPTGVAAVAAAVPVPVIAIGGVTADRVGELREAGAYGVAVVGAVSDAPDPARATADLAAALAAPFAPAAPAAPAGPFAPAPFAPAGPTPADRLPGAQDRHNFREVVPSEGCGDNDFREVVPIMEPRRRAIVKPDGGRS